MNTTNRSPLNLGEVLREIENDTRLEMEQFAAQRAHCINVPRGAELAFAPSQASESERAHIVECRWCSRLLTKLRAAEHPAIALLYAARWQRLPGKDQSEVTRHVETCPRCKAVGALGRLFGSGWVEEVYARLRTALYGTFVMPAAVGLNKSPAAARKNEHEVFETAEWTVTVQREKRNLVVDVYRRADGRPHERAHVVLLGAGSAIDLDVPLEQVRDLWTGSRRVTNRWMSDVDPVEISVIVTED